jgi:biopolymer transport protein TolQ
MEQSALQMVLQAGYVVKGVLIILLLFSITSWTIIFYKWRLFAKADDESATFMKIFNVTKNPRDLFTSSKKFELSPLARLFKSVYSEKTYSDKQELRRMLKRYSALESARLERYLNFLATTGTTTPFIGLFGTVWGIMNAFTGIGTTGSASLAVVAPGIAEALVTTAMGLAAAIPAVIAFNYYLSRVNRIIIFMEDYSEELVDYILS